MNVNHLTWGGKVAEKAYLNKEFTPKVKFIVTSVGEEFANIIKIRNIK